MPTSHSVIWPFRIVRSLTPGTAVMPVSGIPSCALQMMECPSRFNVTSELSTVIEPKKFGFPEQDKSDVSVYLPGWVRMLPQSEIGVSAVAVIGSCRNRSTVKKGPMGFPPDLAAGRLRWDTIYSIFRNLILGPVRRRPWRRRRRLRRSRRSKPSSLDSSPAVDTGPVGGVRSALRRTGRQGRYPVF